MSPDLTTILAERVADHFEDGRVDGAEVHTGLGDLRIECEVFDVSSNPGSTAATLFFWLRGSAWGQEAVFASVSGYGSEAMEAVVSGGCFWSCAVRPLLMAASGQELSSTMLDSLISTDVSVHGRRFRLLVGALDRAMTPQGADPGQVITAGRARLPQQVMTRAVLENDAMPVLVGEHAYFVSTFSSSNGPQIVTEVKIQGRDWPELGPAITPAVDLSAAGVPLLRELAVLIPVEPAKASGSGLQRTMDQIGRQFAEVTQPAGWRGWNRHGGRLGAVLDPAALEEQRNQLGRLPGDLAEFFTKVAGPGAGPGYGFEPFRTDDGIVLAEGGCGTSWVLRDDGTVWCAAPILDELVPVAGSVWAWFADWLDSAMVGRGMWQQWGRGGCSSDDVLVQLIDRYPDTPLPQVVTPGGMRLQAGGGSSHLAEGLVLDPCHHCIATWAAYGVSDDVWPLGYPSVPGRTVVASDLGSPKDPTSEAPSTARRRWWQRGR